jgi:hypothetical protein
MANDGNDFGDCSYSAQEDCEGNDDMLSQLASENRDVRNAALEWVVENFWALSSTPSGCRTVQRAVEVADFGHQTGLAKGLHGRVLDAAASPHANHVLQKCITTLSPEQMKFVVAELEGKAVVVARHRYGCRVLERLIEHSPQARIEGIIDEVLDGVEALCRHAFGNFVIQHILEHGTDAHRQRVASSLCTDALRFAKHRVASHVIKAALLHSHGPEKDCLIQALAGNPADFSTLAHHHCGSFVVRELRRAKGS